MGKDKKIDPENTLDISTQNPIIEEEKDNRLIISDETKLVVNQESVEKNEVLGYIIKMYVISCFLFTFGFYPVFDFIGSSIIIEQTNKSALYTFMTFSILLFGLLQALDKGFFNKDDKTINRFNEFAFSRKGMLMDLLMIFISLALYIVFYIIGIYEHIGLIDYINPKL